MAIQIVRVILKNNREEILLLKRANTKYSSGEWVLPGGKVESGENIEKACRKEVKEEAGLEISNLKFLSKKNSSQGELNFVTFYFKADFTGNVKINKESSEFAWLGKEDLDKFKIAFGQKDILKEVF